MPDREALLQVGVLTFTLTVALTQGIVETLGTGNSGNRQVQIMLTLHTRPGLTPSRLATALGMSRSAMSHALARLQTEGLIERSVDDKDRRSMRLELSLKGAARLRRFENAVRSTLIDHADELRAGTGLLGFPVGPGRSSELTVLEAGERLARVSSAYADGVRTAVPPLAPLEWRERFVVTLIQLHRELRPAQLAAALQMSTSGTSTLLDRLESLGLVQRTQGPDAGGDRRAVLVSFTPDGAKAAEEALDVFSMHAEALADAMSSALIRSRSDGAA